MEVMMNRLTWLLVAAMLVVSTARAQLGISGVLIPPPAAPAEDVGITYDVGSDLLYTTDPNVNVGSRDQPFGQDLTIGGSITSEGANIVEGNLAWVQDEAAPADEHFAVRGENGHFRVWGNDNPAGAASVQAIDITTQGTFLVSRGSNPAAPTEGQLYWNSVVKVPMFYNGTSWQGTGNVTGPASATDNTVPRYDGTTGKVIQTSGVTIDDSNNITGVGNLTAVNLLPTGDLNIATTKNLNVAGWFFVPDQATVAISSGSIASLGGSLHKLADATADLDGIANASSVESRYLTLLAPASGTITCRSAQSPSGAKPFALAAPYRTLTGNASLTVYYNGTTWQETSYTPNVAEHYDYLPAADFWSVASGDWVTATFGTVAADSNTAGITVMQLSGSVANGFGFEFQTPSVVNSVRFSLTARAETAPGGTRTAPLAITCRQSVDDTLESAWGTARSMGTWTFTTDEKWQTVETTITAANLGISANAVVQCEVARNPADTNDTMTEAMTIRGMKWTVQ